MSKIEAKVVGVEQAMQKALKATDLLVEAIKSSFPKAVAEMDVVLRDQAREIAPIGTPESTGDPKYQVSRAYQRSIRARIRTKQIGDMTIGQVSSGGYVINPNTKQTVDYQLIQPRWGTRWNQRGIELGFSKQAPRGVLVPAAHKSATAMRNKANHWIVKGVKRNMKGMRL